MELQQIAQWRMHNLGLWGSRSKKPRDAVARLGAMQAQEFPYAKWSLAQRVADTDDAAISKAFDKGTFLRTHVLRPTWHFVLPKDIRWMLALTAPRVRSMSASYDRQLDLDDRVYARTNKLIAKALEGGDHLTRKEIVAALNRSKISGTGQRFGHIMLRAELDGVVCSGIARGKQQTYALLDERAPTAKELGRDEALAELGRRYFLTRGPATLKDFSWWSSLKMADCRAAVEMLGRKLDNRVVDDRTYWFERGTGPPKLIKGQIDLVQVYDEAVVSYTVSRDALTAPGPERIPREIMFFWHPILLDGQILGHWRRRNERKAVAVEMFLYEKLSKDRTGALTEAVRRFEGFVGQPIEVRMTA
jgi:Winged helix DNA-binding domain